jgi:hypothetical protein
MQTVKIDVFACAALCGILASPVAAQQSVGNVDGEQPVQIQPIKPAATPSARSSHVAGSSIGEVGKRQTKAQAAPNIAPMGRINNRINNRIQSRIRNRIDRNYTSSANSLDAFRSAEDQARGSLQPTP